MEFQEDAIMILLPFAGIFYILFVASASNMMEPPKDPIYNPPVKEEKHD
jgi:hypothetical protein